MRVICRKPNATPGRLRARRWRVFWPISRPAPLAIRASIGCAPSSPAAIGRRRLRQQTRRDAAGKSACDAERLSGPPERGDGRDERELGLAPKRTMSAVCERKQSSPSPRQKPRGLPSSTISCKSDNRDGFSFRRPPCRVCGLTRCEAVQKYFGRLARLSPVSLRVGVFAGRKAPGFDGERRVVASRSYGDAVTARRDG